MPDNWLQIKGDPSIRRFLFAQTRVDNNLDVQAENVFERMEQLFQNHGVFHIKVYCSRGQVTLWQLDDPYSYKVMLMEEFLSVDLNALFPLVPYPDFARVPADRVPVVLHKLKMLRQGDQTVYLRSGSLNIISGRVGLNFSCDGSHYVDYARFLSLEAYNVA